MTEMEERRLKEIEQALDNIDWYLNNSPGGESFKEKTRSERQALEEEKRYLLDGDYDVYLTIKKVKEELDELRRLKKKESVLKVRKRKAIKKKIEEKEKEVSRLKK